MLLSDNEIGDAVMNSLTWDSRVESADIKVDVENGNVILSGTVPSLTSRLYSEHNAYLIPGVIHVINKIDIRFSEEAPADEEIRANLKNILFWDTSIDAARIDILSSSGIVTLKGTVNSIWNKTKAEEIASSISGVQKIINELAVVPTISHRDEDIANHIIWAFAQDKYIIASKVTVTVSNGNVTLAGSAPSWVAKHRAEQMANYIEGVTNVENKMTVQRHEKTG